MHKLFLVSLLLVYSIAGFAQERQELSDIDKQELRDYVRILTSDSIHGRQTGSIGQKKAAHFIARKFEQLGLKTNETGSYYQKFNVNQTYWGEAFLEVKGRKLINFHDMAYLGHRVQNDEIELEVVFGGNGEAKQLDQIDVAGKLVLIFLENIRASYEVMNQLEARNAYGAILANPSNEKQFESIKNTYRDYLLQKRFSLLSDTVRTPDKYLSQFVIPNYEIKSILGESKNSLIKLMEANEIKSCPISNIKIKCERIIETLETENVVGLLKGVSDQAIIVTAHYDTYTPDEFQPHEYRPGADDNATGVAALLELAQEFSMKKKLSHTIIFVATTGEEVGLLGAGYYVRQMDTEKVWCNLNVDMIGRFDKAHSSNHNYLYSVSAKWEGVLNDAIQRANTTQKNLKFDFTYYNSKDNSYSDRGDHASFSRRGIPALMFFSGVHEDYHKPTDTYNKIEYNLLEERVLLIAEVLRLLVNSNP